MKDYLKNVVRFDIKPDGVNLEHTPNPVTGRWALYDAMEKAYLNMVDDMLVLLARAANRGHFLHKFNCPFYSLSLCEKYKSESSGICSKEKPWSKDSIKVNVACFLEMRDKYFKETLTSETAGGALEGHCSTCDFSGCFQCLEGSNYNMAKQYADNILTKEEQDALLCFMQEYERKPSKDELEAFMEKRNTDNNTPTVGTESDSCKGCNHIVDPKKAFNTAKYSLGDAAREAIDIVCGERQDQYGNPEDSFKNIAAFWSAFLGVDITPYQACVMMILFKLARVKGQAYHRDNFVDAIGYAIICADRMGKSEGKK